MQAGREFGVPWEQDMVRGVGTATQTDSHSSCIAMVKKFSKAGGRVDALNTVAPHAHTHTHTRSEPSMYPNHNHNRNACLVQRYVGLLQ